MTSNHHHTHLSGGGVHFLIGVSPGVAGLGGALWGICGKLERMFDLSLFLL